MRFQELISEEKSGNLGQLLSNELLSSDDVLLVPKHGILESRSHAKLKPFIYSSPMDTVTGISLAEAMLEEEENAIVCRFLPEEWNKTFFTCNCSSHCFFAVGVKHENLTVFKKKVTDLQYMYGRNLRLHINIDVAHGDTDTTLDMYKLYREIPQVDSIMSGSIATPAQAIRVITSGCTHLRVGIGCGSMCSTRIKTGVGLPLLSSIYFIHRELEDRGMRKGVTILADGGIKTPGDAVKYIAAGADGIILGNRLSTTKESAGWKTRKGSWLLEKEKRKYKNYRGQASADFQLDHYNKEPICSEGESGPVIYPNTTVKKIIEEFRGGVSSALSYLGMKSIDELKPENVTFVKITHAGYIEGTIHGL